MAQAHPSSLSLLGAAATLAAALAVSGPAAGGEAGPTAAAGQDQLVAVGPIHPCTFYRGQAYRMGVTHFATEMLWACEEIALRRAAGMALSDRLLAAEAALIAYRDAFADARNARDEAGARQAPSEGLRLELAETTGVLAALEAISGGF
jgi:hypothetical protein